METELTFDALNCAIGEMICAFGQLEAEVGNSLALVCDEHDHEIGTIIADKLQFRDSVNIFGQIAAHRLQGKREALAALKKLCKELDGLAEVRNNVVHSQWWGGTNVSAAEYLSGKPAALAYFHQKPVRRRKSLGERRHSDLTEFRKQVNHIAHTCSALTTFSKEYLS